MFLSRAKTSASPCPRGGMPGARSTGMEKKWPAALRAQPRHSDDGEQRRQLTQSSETVSHHSRGLARRLFTAPTSAAPPIANSTAPPGSGTIAMLLM